MQMKFPYGNCDFAILMRENYFYADRSDRIPLLESAGRQLLFLRPRRFGKSLLLSMLENYYDVAKANQFVDLFGNLQIGRNPTGLQNQYIVLKWDFSVVSSQGNLSAIRQALYDHLNESIHGCIRDHAALLSDQEVPINPQNALKSFESLQAAVRQTPYKLYLLIDEYDNFANEIAMNAAANLSSRRYQELLQGEGILKTVFKAVKAASAGRGLDRVFITGVSPLVLSDLTSGYNIAENISQDERFADLCGFTTTEIVEILEKLSQSHSGNLPPSNESLGMMRTFYNGYCFDEDETSPESRVYNPTLSFYFLNQLQRRGKHPTNLLDVNLAMDQNKLSYLASLPHGAELLEDALQGEPALTAPFLVQRFGIAELLEEEKDQTFLLSLLYFFGILTLRGRNEEGRLLLEIPNLVIKQLYVEELRKYRFPKLDWDKMMHPAISSWCQRGDPEKVCTLVEERLLKQLGNRDYRQVNELTIKTGFLLFLGNTQWYQVISEGSAGRGYADLALIVRADQRKYKWLDLLIEFKYVRLQDIGMSGSELKLLSRDQGEQLEVVNNAFLSARKQLERYAEALRGEYSKVSTLRCYAIVALGLERLLWREMCFLSNV